MMRTSKPFHLVATVTLLSCILLPYFPIQAQEDETPDDEIKSLINDLSAPEYSVRENAKEKLLNIGEPAIKHLEEAIKSEEDIELIEGAKEVLEKIKEKISLKRQQVNRNHDGTLTFKINPGMKSSKSFHFALTNPIGESVTIEETEDNFTLTATKGNVTKKYQAKSKEEFREKFPEVYKQYKNIIDGNSFTIITRDGTVQILPFRQGRQDNDQDPVEKWFSMPQVDNEQYKRMIELFRQMFNRDFDQDFFGWDQRFRQEFNDLERKLDELLKEFNSFRYNNKDFRKWNFPDNNDNNRVQTETAPKDPAKRKLGLSLDVLAEDEAEKRGLEFDTIYIKKIDKDSLLYKEGLREGDAIVEINDSKVNTTYLVRKKLVELLEKNGGKIVINRDGEFKELRVKLDTY